MKFVVCVVMVDSTAPLFETTEEIRAALFLDLYDWTCPCAGARAPLVERTAMSANVPETIEFEAYHLSVCLVCCVTLLRLLENEIDNTI